MASPGTTLHDWIKALPEDGKYVLTRAQASTVTDASDAAIKMIPAGDRWAGWIGRRRPCLGFTPDDSSAPGVAADL